MMKKIYAFVIVSLLIFGGINTSMANNTEEKIDLSNKNIMVIELEYGKVFIKLIPELAPNHVERIKKLVNSGFYDGVVFHRVIDGFMAQTGDPTGTGRGGSGQNIKAEFTDEPFLRGVVGMARAQHVDSADSQFFIMLADGRFLDNNYTVFGKVISGMEYVDMIKKGEPPTNPDKMLKVSLISEDEM